LKAKNGHHRIKPDWSTYGGQLSASFVLSRL
jgi:hypothetical protein